MSQITLIVKVDVKPERLIDFIKATEVAQYAALSYEQGCFEYTLNSDIDNENGVILVEIYQNQKSFDFHKTTPHFLTWRSDVEEMMNTPRQVTRLNEINLDL